MMLAWLAAAALAASAPRDAATPRPDAPSTARPRAAQDPPPSDITDTLMDDIKIASFPSNGWTYLASADDGIVFYRFPIQRQSGLPRMSTRWELAKARTDTTGRILSFERVEDMDCIRGVSHTVRRATYKGHNLVGPIIDAPAADEPWIAPEPGSLDEIVFKKACAPPP